MVRTADVLELGLGLPQADAEVIVGIENVRSRIAEIARRCTRSLWAFQPGGAQSAACLEACRPLDEESLAGGVDMRTVYLDSVRNDRATIRYAEWLTSQGAQLRTAPELPLRLLVVDQMLAVLPIDPVDSSMGAVVVTSPTVVLAISALFLAVWRDSRPFAVSRPRRSSLLNDQERTALEMWAQGLADDVVARRLGVSHRTARRISESLAATLGARSRFELGLKAGEQGLIRSTELS
ncbi:hypothetical protein [Cellulomonas sp. URHB0016]